MDPFSDVLALLDPKSALPARLTAGGAWALQFPAFEGVKFCAVVRGGCWLAMEGLDDPIALETGDCFLLTDGRTYSLTTDLSLEAEDAYPVFARTTDGSAHHGVGDDTLIIGGRFSFDEAHASLLLDLLPPVIHVARASAHAAVMGWVLKHLAEELASSTDANAGASAGIGATLMADHLSHILFVQALRAHLASAQQQQHPVAGWLGALSDPRIAVAIGLLHKEPARRWTVGELAQAAAMSRSSFAERFKTLVGTAPLDYLLHWRMRLAVRALGSGGGKSVSAVALSLGYESESAFSNAFKRVMGRAPKHFKSPARALLAPAPVAIPVAVPSKT